MANNKENLEKWLLIRALLSSDKASEVKEIAEEMIRELKTAPSQDRQ
jgi:hypothetical protein